MLGAIIGAGIGALGSIVGGIGAAAARRKEIENLQRQKQDNQAWFDRKYNEDPTSRADANYILTKTEEAIRDRNKSAAGTQAVMGGTEDSVTATKAANANAIADASAKIAAQNEARKDSVESQYLRNKQEINGQINQYNAQSASNITDAIKGIAGAGASIAGAIDGTEKDGTEKDKNTNS